MTEPECTCDPAKLANICRDIRNEPHLVGCPRWGTPLYDEGGPIPPLGVAWVHNDTGRAIPVIDEETVRARLKWVQDQLREEGS